MSERAMVYGVGVAGLATLRALIGRGYDVVVIDDHASPERVSVVEGLGCDLIVDPSADERRALLATCNFVAPSPGVPEFHPIVEEAHERSIPLCSEFDLGYMWEGERAGGARPMVAVTGTDGKTTTVLMAEEILRASGHRPVACGNTEIPFVEALDLDVDSFVIEATSFRLAFAESFRCSASAWLNLAPDHLDWHTSMETYEQAKARLWAHVRTEDTAIGFAHDPIVMRHLRALECHQIVVGTGEGDYRVEAGSLVSPCGTIMATNGLTRSLPHDRTNALTAAALTIESGLADVESAARALAAFRGPKHRIELVATMNGIDYFDDSKATTPHAALTAMRSFESIVLIAGGRNKGLDLSMMGTERDRLRGVVLIGEARDELGRVFHSRCAVDTADSMDEAVLLASRRARAGDVVLLSPGCTSLDRYSGYAERGDDFARCVRELSTRSDTFPVSTDQMEVAP